MMSIRSQPDVPHKKKKVEVWLGLPVFDFVIWRWAQNKQFPRTHWFDFVVIESCRYACRFLLSPVILNALRLMQDYRMLNKRFSIQRESRVTEPLKRVEFSAIPNTRRAESAESTVGQADKQFRPNLKLPRCWRWSLCDLLAHREHSQTVEPVLIPL